MISVEFKREAPPVMISRVFNHPGALSLFSKAPEKKLKKGDILYSGHNAQHHLYLVTKGIVKLNALHDGKEMLEDYFVEGEIFNCEAILNTHRNNLSAEAMTQMTSVRKVPVKVFKEAMQLNTAIYKDVFDSLHQSLTRSQERLRRMTLLNSRHRIVDFLIKHTLKAGRKVGFEYVVKPAITHKELGIIAGTSRQTATTVLNELRTKGMIHFNRSYLIVRDLDALKRVALDEKD